MSILKEVPINRDLKTIVFVSTLSFNDRNSAGYNRILNYARALASNSINVVLYSFHNKYKNLTDLEILYDNIYIIKKTNKSFSASNSFFSLNRLRGSFNGETSYVFYPSSRFLADIIFLFVLKVLSSNKIYCEINELRYAYVLNRSLSKNSYSRIIFSIKNTIDFFFYKIFEFTYSKYNGVITISNNLYNYIVKYNSNVVKIPILVDIPQNRDYFSLAINDYFKVGFFGTISFKKEGLINLFQAIKNLNKNNYCVQLFLYGPISESEGKLLKHFIKYNKISDLIYYNGIIPHDNILIEMRKMNLLILPRPLNKQTNFGFSTKLGEYLISGVPVLVTNVSDNGLYIKDGHNGFMVDEISSNGFESKIVQIIANYDNIKDKISIEGYKTALKYFDYRIYKNTLTEFLLLNDK